ncbi:NADPH-dependent 7-cyano-7-deazaguanine reductase QueF [Parachitinimonas caeni]|uniref:NADPH-dependent 7-cyano-7-deazaguanine reductase n=1 Tax=Parachitinimonas caeni TaxID=3031301 RepID=A0ABT7DZT6_9NEIS|nr:NADPH-dependent 7-cyano-7-deazaguanine reductase QueF [Parachitinimonas caeni]MDK2124598.1 NADPH-dependent 7-cyano-7-deazaguanine reductase QueF [Parachitinimonas caeni]
MHEQHSPLGKSTAYIEHYAPELLFPIPRLTKRQEIGIDGSLPFGGVDIWNGYELSWLNARGKPQVAIARFSIPAESPNLIESKSFKLYLNSFNQTRLASVDELKQKLIADLSAACGASVSVKLLEPADWGTEKIGGLEGELLDRLDIDVAQYQPAPQLLHTDPAEAEVEETLVSHLLKSNCLVTGQPDWGSVQIHYIGAPINQEALLRYLISFRQHNEFHEQCVERIFTDIMRQCRPTRLSVYARYTRRGGLDINPFRTNFSQPMPANVRQARQ